jgi:alcohol dehydrogenase class IV
VSKLPERKGRDFVVQAALFRVPPVIRYGEGTFAALGESARELGLSRVLLVTDPGVVRLGIAGAAETNLAAASISVTRFEGVQPDPTLANVAAGLERLRAVGAVGLVAVGGGSSIDCAKAIAVAHGNPGPLPAFVGVERIPRVGLPVIAVPTTAGTGSEATRVAVITDTERDVKMMFASRHLVCAAAIVDPLLTLSMPPSLTAAVGVDALAHAIEAYVSRRAQPLTDQLALSAVRRIGAHLRRACADGQDRPARAAMMLGAMEAGMAFSNASVALVHGMARPLGACFHLAHGISIAVLLPVVTRFSLPAAPARYAEIGAALGVGDLAAGLQALNREVGIPTLRELGVPRDRYDGLLPRMAADALESGSPANNPRPAAVEEIIGLYRQVYEEG